MDLKEMTLVRTNKIGADAMAQLANMFERLDKIEQKVLAMDMPEEYSEHWYTLHEYLTAARDNLFKLRSR